MTYTNDQLITTLSNYVECVYDSEKVEVLSVLQRIYGNEQGTKDFFNYYFTANYKYDLLDIAKFIADDQNQTLKEFVNEWLQE